MSPGPPVLSYTAAAKLAPYSSSNISSMLPPQDLALASASAWNILFYVFPNKTRDDSTHVRHQMVNTEIRLIIFFATENGDAL